VISHINNEVGEILLPLVHKDITFVVTNSMLQLIKYGALFGGFEHEDPNDHLHKFLNVCNLFLADGNS